jgi:hypothetical protein
MSAIENMADQLGEQSTAKTKREVKTVELTDGRTVEFAGKRRMLKNAETSQDGSEVTVVFDFVHGETRTFVIDTSDKLFAKFAAHGIMQKIGDEVAGLEDPEDMVLAVDEIISRLEGGEWGVERSRGEGNGMAGLSVLAKALVEVSGKTPEAVREFLKTKSNAEKLALRENAALKPVVTRLEAEKKKPAPKDKPVIDTDSMLGELAA